jgi:hypothetical protein
MVDKISLTRHHKPSTRITEATSVLDKATLILFPGSFYPLNHCSLRPKLWTIVGGIDACMCTSGGWVTSHARAVEMNWPWMWSSKHSPALTSTSSRDSAYYSTNSNSHDTFDYKRKKNIKNHAEYLICTLEVTETCTMNHN